MNSLKCIISPKTVMSFFFCMTAYNNFVQETWLKMVIKEGTLEAKKVFWRRDWLGFCAPLVVNWSSTRVRQQERVMAFQEPCSLKVALDFCPFQSSLLVFCLQSRFGLWLVAEWSAGLRITWSDSSWCSGVPVFSSERLSFSWEPRLRWWPRRTPSSGPSGSKLNIPHSNMHRSDEKKRTAGPSVKKTPTW